MNRRWFLAGLAAAIAVAGVSADARMHAPYRGHRIVAAGPMLDGTALPATTGACSLRKLRTAYVGSSLRIRRTSDNLEADIGFIGNDFNTSAALAHCNATTCYVKTCYSQDGAAALDITQTTGTSAAQPQLIFNCFGINSTGPCWQTTFNTQTLNTVANVTPATGIVSMSVVANRAAGLGLSVPVRQNGATGNRVRFGGANAMSSIGGTSGSLAGPVAPEGVWHSGVFTITGDPATSVSSIDGVDNTSGVAVVGSTTAGAQGLVGTGSTTVNQVEMIVFDNVALSPAQRARIAISQQTYIGAN